ncbi:DUF2206 domain-containing protein [Chloroflexota bacterium]
MKVLLIAENGNKRQLQAIIIFLLFTTFAILFDIPILRQILALSCYTFLPGILFLRLFRLDSLGFIEKCILGIGMSIAFMLLFGYSVDQIYYALGYKTPLSTLSLTITFGITLMLLAILEYWVNRQREHRLFGTLGIKSKEIILIIPALLLLILSIAGTSIMNAVGSNLILMVFFFCIVSYMAVVSFVPKDLSDRTLPYVIFLIGLALVLVFSLRSEYVLGVDVHREFAFFQETYNAQHFSIRGTSILNSALSISLLPAVYKSLAAVNSEYFFKLFYSITFTLVPLTVFVISRNYLRPIYAFLAACFYMSQQMFLWASYSPRTTLAVFYAALVIMVLFHKRISTEAERVFLMVFLVCIILSHYSTTFIFFFMLLAVIIGERILSFRKEKPNILFGGTMLALFGVILVLWHSQIMDTPFRSATLFLNRAFVDLGQVFATEAKGETVQALAGKDILAKGIPQRIYLFTVWATFAFIGIGCLALLARYKRTIMLWGGNTAFFLKEKLHPEYMLLIIAGCLVLVATVVLPYVSAGYSIDRVYSLTTLVLSPVFIIGILTISKHLRVKSQLVILIVLIPYFLCTTGIMYQVFGYPHAVTLNSKGTQDYLLVHDQEVAAANWMESYSIQKTIYTFAHASLTLESHAINRHGPVYELLSIDLFKLLESSYIYLDYSNVVKNEYYLRNEIVGLEDYSVFALKNKVYANGGSDTYYIK